jgi:hypothetical protein
MSMITLLRYCLCLLAREGELNRLNVSYLKECGIDRWIDSLLGGLIT